MATPRASVLRKHLPLVSSLVLAAGFIGVALLSTWHAPTADARRRGMVGYSGNPATNDGEDCTKCHQAHSSEHVALLRQEFRVLSQLFHPSLAPVYDFGRLPPRFAFPGEASSGDGGYFFTRISIFVPYFLLTRS